MHRSETLSVFEKSSLKNAHSKTLQKHNVINLKAEDIYSEMD